MSIAQLGNVQKVGLDVCSPDAIWGSLIKTEIRNRCLDIVFLQGTPMSEWYNSCCLFPFGNMATDIWMVHMSVVVIGGYRHMKQQQALIYEHVLSYIWFFMNINLSTFCCFSPYFSKLHARENFYDHLTSI